MTSGPALPEPCRPSEPLSCPLGAGSDGAPPSRRGEGPWVVAMRRCSHGGQPTISGWPDASCWRGSSSGLWGRSRGHRPPAVRKNHRRRRSPRPLRRSTPRKSKLCRRRPTRRPRRHRVAGHPAKTRAKWSPRRAHRPSGSMPRTNRLRRSPSVDREIAPARGRCGRPATGSGIPDESRFVWVGGSWHVPPAGMVWSSGRWQHDAGGWYWVPGSWTRRANPARSPRTGPPGGSTDRRPSTRTTRRRRHPGPTSSTSRATMRPLRPAIAWPGSPASGRRSSPDGTGSRPDGSAARTAGTSARATGSATGRLSSSRASRRETSAGSVAMRTSP